MPERSVAFAPALQGCESSVWADDLPRPSRMLARPEPIDVIAPLPDDAPRMFVWRRKRYRVTQGDGPERLHGEWWPDGGIEGDTPLSARDYSTVETEGVGSSCLFRLGYRAHSSNAPLPVFLT